MLSTAENQSLIKVPKYEIKRLFLALLGSLSGAIRLQQDEGNYPGNENSSSSHTTYGAYTLSHKVSWQVDTGNLLKSGASGC